MALIAFQEVCLAFGHVPLLDHVDFALEAGERVALIGRNGTGKSSLLKILTGQIAPDAGEVRRQQIVRVALVPQEPVFGDAVTVVQAVSQGMADTVAMLERYDELVADPAHDEDEMARLQTEIDRVQGWMLASRVSQVLSRLGLSGDVPLSSLSGGQRKRVALARGLVAEPNVLVLDEPTNHLDVESIQWLEDMLLAFRGSVMLVTHDRCFLDRVATRIVELDRGQLRSYPGNFTAYQTRKKDELHAEQLAQARFDKLLSQEEIWIRKGVEARRTRSVGRVERLVQLRREHAARRSQQGRVNMSVDSGVPSGKLVAELLNVTKGWPDADGVLRDVVHDFSAIILRGDKIGLIGPNGAGKTTLLKLILGEIQADSGSVRLGTQLQVAYFDQLRAHLDENRTVKDSIVPGGEWIEIGGKRKHVMSYLTDFLFAPERANSPVSSLSGGERNRLLLARLFARPANVLVLDEPTNDLDIDTLELLEDLLQEFDGTVFLVSHDRAFLDNVVTDTIAWEGPGAWREYVGGYEDWLRQRSTVATASTTPVASAEVTGDDRKTRRPIKLSFKEQRELDQIPDRLATLEVEQTALTARLSDPALYQTGAEELRKVTERAAKVELELTQLIERWEALEAKQAGPG